MGQGVVPVKHSSPAPLEPRLNLRKSSLTPQEMIRAMVAKDQTQRREPGATVEVIGYDDEAALRLLALHVANKSRLEFRSTDKLQHRELYDFMHQDPSRPSPVLFVPMLAGGKVTRADDKWLK